MAGRRKVDEFRTASEVFKTQKKVTVSKHQLLLRQVLVCSSFLFLCIFFPGCGRENQTETIDQTETIELIKEKILDRVNNPVVSSIRIEDPETRVSNISGSVSISFRKDVGVLTSIYEEVEYSLEELLQHPERSEYFYFYTKESWEEEKELLQALYANIKSDDDYETYLEMMKDSWRYFKTVYPSIEDYQKICEDLLSQVFPRRTFMMESTTFPGSRWIMPDLVASHSKGIAPHVDFWYQLKQDGYIVQNRFNRVLIRIGLCDGYIYKVLYSEDIFKDVPRSELEQLKKKEEVLEKVNDPLWHRKILATIMAGYRNTGPELSRAFLLPPYVLQKTDPLFVEKC